MFFEDSWAVRKMTQNTGDFNPAIQFLNVDYRWLQGLQSLTPTLPAMPYGFRRTLGLFLIFFGWLFSFFSVLFYLMREKGKFIILSGVFLFCTG
jgi:hypothetical protein